MKEFRFVGLHADELEDGRPLEPGTYTGPISEHARKNKQLIDDGLLLEVEDGTAGTVAKLDEAAYPTLVRNPDLPVEEPAARSSSGSSNRQSRSDS